MRIGYLIIAAALGGLSVCSAQQPQTQIAPTSAINAKYVNGVAPGYAPTAGSGLTLNLGGGTANCAGTIEQYAASTLTMTASMTNYVYLNTAALCVPAVKTTIFTTADIPIAAVVTSGSAITAITDDRTLFNSGTGGTLTAVTATAPVACTTTGSSVNCGLSGITQTGSGSSQVDTFPGSVAVGTTVLLGDGLGPINVKSKGAKGDERFFTDASMTAGSYTVTSATGAFTPSDSGKVLTVNAGSPGLLTATYVSGGTQSGAASGFNYCYVTGFNGGGTGAVGVVGLSYWNGSTSVIPPNGHITISVAGDGYTSMPTTATLSNGTGTCSGTITITATPNYPAITGTATYVSATTMTLSVPAISTVSGANAEIGTDDSAAFVAAIAQASSLGGGTVYVPTGNYLILSQLSIPNNGGGASADQPTVTITGEGGAWNAALWSVTFLPPAASMMDMRYSGSGAKIYTTGNGSFYISKVSLEDHGYDSTPFLQTIGTAIFPNNVVFVGSGPGQMASQNDAIVLGTSSAAPFQGYGTVISSNLFSKIHHGVLELTYANAVVTRDNTWANTSGGDSAFTIDGTEGGTSTNQAGNNVWTGNLFEIGSYLTAVTLNGTLNNYGFGNTFWDGTAIYITLKGVSTGNSCIACGGGNSAAWGSLDYGTNDFFALDGSVAHGWMHFSPPGESGGITIGNTGTPQANIDNLGSTLLRYYPLQFSGTDGSTQYQMGLASPAAPTTSDFQLGPVSNPGLMTLKRGSNNFTYATADNGVDLFQIGGGTAINGRLLLKGTSQIYPIQFDSTAYNWQLYEQGSGSTATMGLVHIGEGQAITWDALGNTTFGANATLAAGKYLNFDTGANQWEFAQSGTGATATFKLTHALVADALSFADNGDASFSGNVNVPNGKISINTTAQTSLVNIGAGSAITAPLQFTSGAILTTPEAGAVEFDGANLFYTDSTLTRHALCTADGTGCPSTTAAISGMTTGQLPVAASATTVTSSIAYATANTASTVVERDGSGNFAAGTITANLTGIASGNVTPTTLDNATLSASLTSVTDSGLTSGYYPLAGTGGLLGNGHLDDGVTVFGAITSSEPLILDYSSTSRVYSELYNATGHAWFINSTGSGGYASAPANSLAFQDGTGMATPLYLTSTSVVALQPVSMPTGSTVNSTAICLADGTNCPAYSSLAITSVSWSIQPALFSTSTMLGPVYYTTYSGSVIPTMIARLSGAISCTSAPVINFMDLGTSPTTSYGSATPLGSLTTGTSDGVYGSGTHNLGAAGLTVNHYYGIGFSAGTCVTAPTIDVSVFATW